MYKYEDCKPELFTDEGQRRFLAVRDHVHKTLNSSGAIRMMEAISLSGGDSWEKLTCVDRLVELGEIREIAQPEGTPGQYRIFVSNQVN